MAETNTAPAVKFTYLSANESISEVSFVAGQLIVCNDGKIYADAPNGTTASDRILLGSMQESFVILTQAEYDALATKDSGIIYLIEKEGD